MHARHHDIHHVAPDAHSRHATSLIPVRAIRIGQHFIRTDSPSEVLVRMSAAGGGCDEGQYTWAIVIAVNHDSEGYVPGQLLKLRRDMHVRVVHEARAPVFALEQ